MKAKLPQFEKVTVTLVLIAVSTIIGIILINEQKGVETDGLQEVREIISEQSMKKQPDSDVIRIVTGEYPPYVSEHMVGGGFQQKVVELAMDAVGLSYEIEYFPWARCMKMLEEGEAFATFPWSKTPERESHYLFSDPFYIGNNESFVMYYYEPVNDFSHLDGSGFDAFQDFDIGGLYDYFYISLFESNGIRVDLSAEEAEVFEKLRAGRVDFLPADRYVSEYILDLYYPDEKEDFKYIEVPFLEREEDYSMMLDIDNMQAKWFLEKFNEGMNIIKTNGVYDEILSQDAYFD